MKKRTISLIIAICLFVGLLPMNVFAYTQGYDGMGPVVITGGRRDFKWPVPGHYNLQSCFYDHRNHCAIDISAPINTPAVASYTGTVLKAVDGGTSYYGDGFGNYVVLQHSYTLSSGTITLYTRYSHLNSVSVKEGATVKAGEEVGKIGTTGSSEGYHLDFQILYGNWQPYQTYSIDPYANQLLELPSNLSIYDSWACGSSYYALAKEIYATPLSYIGQCTSYASHCIIKVTSSTTYIKSLPCSEATDASSTNVETASKNATYEAIGLYKNTASNLWYKVKAKNGSTGYMYAGDTTFVEQLKDDLTVSGVAAPTELKKGSTFSIKGTIATQYQTITKVGAWVDNSSGTYVTGGTADVNATSYNLNASSVDNAVRFNDLGAGKYTYCIGATIKTYYASSATAVSSKSVTVDLYESTFSVVENTACSHSYSSKVTTAATCVNNGTRTYTCTKCGASYTEAIAATGVHTYGSWTTTQAATCTAAGTQQKKCTGCSAVQTQSIAAKGHSYGSWVTTTAAGCTTTGTQKKTCSSCGDVQTQSISATGHNYKSETIPANCTESEKIRYTCQKCGDTYDKYTGDEYSDWSTTKPTGVDESLIESKTQYRYADYQTTTSYETSLSGYSQISSTWQNSGSGTVQYVKSWPSGFSTGHSLYSTYNKSAKSNSETTTNKTAINSDKITGYLYYHWCRGTYTEGPINRATRPTQTGEFNSFHAFYSTTAPSSLTAASDGDGSYTYGNGSCCKDSHWYYYVPVYTQSYTTYRKLFTYGKWGSWSAWSDSVYTANSNRKVETRTLYRYVNTQLGDHTWNSGTVTTNPGCTTTGIKTYTCTACGTTKTEKIAATGEHNWSAWTTTVEPTCTSAGQRKHTCTVCAETRTEEIAAKGHSYVSLTVEPQCETQGYTQHGCGDCYDYYEDAFVPALGHDYQSGYCTRCEAKDPNYQFVTAQIQVGTVSGKPGEAVTVPVSISNNPGFAGFTFVIDYDSSVMTLDSIAKGDILSTSGSGAFTAGTTTKTVNWTDSANTTENGVVLYLAFKIADNAPDGDYSVSVSLKNGNSTNFVDENAHAQGVTFQSGKINVRNVTVAPDAPQIVVGSATASAGNTVTVEILLENNPGISSVVLKIDYDKTRLKLESAQFGSAFSEGAFVNYNLPYITLVRSGNCAENVSLVTITFSVLADAEEGEAYVTLEYSEGDITNFDEQDVTFAVVPGSVTVIDYVPGDINGDNKVNSKDLTRLLKYISHEEVAVNEAALDVNGDGKVNSKDLTRLLKYISHEDVEIH